MSDAVQAGYAELAQFVDRAAGPQNSLADTDLSAQLDAIWSRLNRTRDAVEYISDRTVDLIDRRDALAQQAFHRAGLLIGRDSDAARGIVRLMKRKGGYDAANRWLAGPPALPSIYVHRTSLDQLGCVYTARVRAFPHVLKIGFSLCPERRIRELEYSFGQVFDLESYVAGTPLDEVRAHIDAGQRYIRREFVFDPSCEDIRPGNVPNFIWSASERKLVVNSERHARTSTSGESA